LYTGHFSVALGTSGRSRLPLWLLIVAAFACDLAEGGVAAAGVNDPMRVWSHSLPAAAVWGVLLALGWRLSGGGWRDAGILLAVSLSHVPLDFVTAVKTFVPGVPPFGLNLYARPVADAVVEAALAVAGWSLWRASLEPSRQGSVPARAMLLVLLAFEAMAMVSLMLGGTGADLDALSKFVR
jgi:hypothetical protein